MSDGAFYAKPDPTGSPIDQEVVQTSPGGSVLSSFRQRVRLGGALGSALVDVVNVVGGAVNALGHLLVGSTVERIDGSITQASSLGSALSSGLTGAEGNVGAVVLLTPKMDHGSWTVQVTGAWAGTIVTEVTTALDPTAAGAYWIPVNSRQSAGGRLANNFTVSGLFRGSFGGLTGVRVRATVLTSGSPGVTILTGQQAAVFQNSDVVVQTEFQYYASSAGLNSGWGVSSQEVALANANTEVPLLWLFNGDPVGGRVIYLAKVSKGASGAVKFRRYRTGPGGTQMTRTSGGTLMTINNRANQNAAATAGVAYAGTNLVIANQPTYYEKTVWVTTGGGQVETDEAGGILVPPQTGILFTVTPSANGQSAMVEVAYWDGSTLT